MKRSDTKGYKPKLTDDDRIAHYREFLRTEGKNDADKFRQVAPLFGCSTTSIRASVLMFRVDKEEVRPTNGLFDYRQPFA